MAYLVNKDRDIVVKFLTNRIEKYGRIVALDKEATISSEMLSNAKESLKTISKHPEIKFWNVTSLCAIEA